MFFSILILYFCSKYYLRMKKLFYFLLLIIALDACSPSSSYRQKLGEVESVIENTPDSAKELLEKIPSSLLGEEDKALYYLLLTMANYKLYQPFTNDSLIKSSIEYYKHNGNINRLANAYYYCGAINYEELKEKEKSLLYLKRAEELAEKMKDELLKNKIYELLQGINHASGNYQLSLHYSELLLESSLELNNMELVARSYEHMSNDYRNLGKKDVSDSLIQKSLSYASQSNSISQGSIYGNYANYLMEEKKYSEAKQYLNKAIQAHPFPNHYIMLGKISKLEGDTLQARLYWEKAMTFDNQRFTTKAYKLLGEMYAEQRNYPLVFQMLEKADSVKDAWHEQMRTTQLTEIQHRYDAAITEKALTERKNLWLTIAIAALSAMVLALLAVVYLSRKAKEYKGIIDKNIEHIYQTEQKIELLQSTDKDYEHEIKVLKEQIDRLRETSTMELGLGKTVYDTIIGGGMVHDFTKSKEQALINYYAYTFGKQYHALILPYQKMTLRLTTYLVLQQMGLDDKQICELLNITDSTVRNYRHRLRNPK